MRAGLGLDVSSGVELAGARALGSPRIIFSGPGKRPEELDSRLQTAPRDGPLDIFAELGRLEETAARHGAQIRAGVRLTTEERGLWRKFGIPLARLRAFLARRARPPRRLLGASVPHELEPDPAAHVAFLRRLGGTLGRSGRNTSPASGSSTSAADSGPKPGNGFTGPPPPRGASKRRFSAATGRPEGRVGLAAQPIGVFAARSPRA